MRTHLIVLISLGTLACGGPGSTPDAGSPDAGIVDADADAGASDAGASTDAGSTVCRGSGACTSLTENQCTTLHAADAGCTVRRGGACGDRGTCTGTTMSTCVAGGACAWSGTACSRVACSAQTTEPACLALACLWSTPFVGCDGTSWDCQSAAQSLMPANPAQGCGALAALGLACTP